MDCILEICGYFCDGFTSQRRLKILKTVSVLSSFREICILSRLGRNFFRIFILFQLLMVVSRSREDPRDSLRSKFRQRSAFFEIRLGFLQVLSMFSAPDGGFNV